MEQGIYKSNITRTRLVSFNNELAEPNPALIDKLYVVNHDLYYNNNGSNTNVSDILFAGSFWIRNAGTSTISPGNTNDNLDIGTGEIKSGSLRVNSFSTEASSVGQFDATDKGFLIPRMSSAHREAIVSPATGLEVFDTDLNVFYFYDGIQWMPSNASGTSIGYQLAGRTLNGTYYNCVISVASGKTRVTFAGTWPHYSPNLNPGSTIGQLLVILDNQVIPRYVDPIITPSSPTDFYYTENLSGNYIEFSADLSSMNLSLSIAEALVGISDANPANSDKLATHVYVGPSIYADFPTLEDALLSLASGSYIYVTSGYYYPTADIEVNIRVTIEMMPGVVFNASGTTGTKGLNITVPDVIIKGNGALFKNWNTVGDYAIYVDPLGLRCSIYDCRFTGNDSDIFQQPDTNLLGNFGY